MKKILLIKMFPILFVLFLLFIPVFSLLILFSSSDTESEISTGAMNVSQEVLHYQSIVEEYCNKHGIPDYVNVVLAIMMVESGGKALDVMQSSESLGLPPNSIMSPELSIDVGVKHLANVVNHAKELGLDFWVPVQSYNYGSGFNNFVADRGKKYSFELATSFAEGKSGGKKVPYSNPIAAFNGNWRYQYGNMYYINLVQQYLTTATADSPLEEEQYHTLIKEIEKYQGYPYMFGGSTPQTSFDCSGLTLWAYRIIGINLPRTAEEQYNYVAKIAQEEAKPGDLIFFEGTYKSGISHVGIYINETTMYDASSSGIGYHTWSSGYWKEHLAGFGRVNVNQ